MENLLYALSTLISNPAIIIGFVALIGHVAQKSTISTALQGTIKVILGFIMLQQGAGVIVNTLTPFSKIFEKAFNLNGIIAVDEPIAASVQTVLGSQTTLILLFGFSLNLVIARFSRFKYIFLTGHMMFLFAATMAILFSQMGLSFWEIVFWGALCQGISQVTFPALAQPFVRKIIGNDSVAFGFFGSSAIWFSSYIGKFIGDKNYSTEDIKLPSHFDFVKDMSILMSITMFLVFFITGFFVNSEELSLIIDKNLFEFSLFNSLTLVVGILILLQGVRMFLAEIVPAFKGISGWVVPNSIPALDVPIFFAFAPVAVTFGFISALTGSLLVTFIGGTGVLPVVVLPSVIGLFFMGGAAGVFGNATGGVRGAIASGFILGFLFNLVIALAYPLIDVSQYGITGLWFACTDTIIVVSLIKLVAFIGGVLLSFFA